MCSINISSLLLKTRSIHLKINIIWGLVRNADSQVHPDLLNLLFNEILQAISVQIQLRIMCWVVLLSSSYSSTTSLKQEHKYQGSKLLFADDYDSLKKDRE